MINLKGAMEGKDKALGVTAASAKSGLTRRPQRPLRTQPQVLRGLLIVNL